MINTTYDVVAFGAHPDDLEHAMGGTLIKMCREGMRVLMVHATRGEGGTHGSQDIRIEEARSAADLLKADLHFLDFEDMNIRDTQDARKAVAEVIRRARPHIVFAPYYDYPHMHPDHEEMGRIVRAVTRLTRIKNYIPEVEPHYVKHYFYYILPPHVRPVMIVDITEDMEEWKKLAECYSSQLGGLSGYYELLLTTKKNHGLLIGRPFAEGFYSDRPIDVTNVNLNLLKNDAQRVIHH